MKFFNLINKKAQFKEYIETALQRKSAEAMATKRAAMAKGITK